MFRRYVVCFLILSFFFGTFQKTQAQLGVEPSVGIKISPETPGPNETVTITLTSYSTDLERALVTWTTDGKTALSGYGKTVFSVRSPASGIQKTVNINIVTQTGVEIERTVTIAPQDVDLLWESLDSYAPPFYKGRTLPSRESLIKVTAMPTIRNSIGSKLSDDDLVYTWTHNYNVQQKFSGYGKKYYVYKNAYLDNPDTLSLVVSSRDGKQNARKDLRLSLGNPKILLYAKNPLNSIVSDYALSSDYKIGDESVTLVAVPYFFSVSNKNPTGDSLSYSWKINKDTQTTPVKKNELTIKKPAGISGTSSIEISINNPGTLYQKKTTSFSVEY